MGGGSREARVRHDHLGAVLLRPQDVLHRHRVRFSRVAADEEHRPGVVHVVVRVRHRPVAPGIRYPGHGGGMTDSRLVIDVVRAPEGGELAEQVGLLVAVLGGAEPVHRVRTRFLPDTLHQVANLIDSLVPGHALPLAPGELHRVAQPPLAVPVLAHRRALGAVRAEVEGRLEVRLLTGPHAVLHLGDHAAAHRAVRADASPELGGEVLLGRSGGGLRLAHHRRRQHARDCGASDREPRASQEPAAVDRLAGPAHRHCGDARGGRVSSDQFHRRTSIRNRRDGSTSRYEA